jgi:hypothetical protein
MISPAHCRRDRLFQCYLDMKMTLSQYLVRIGMAGSIMFALPLAAATAPVLPAQAVLFDQYEQAGNRFIQHLAAISPDGTGEHTVTVNLPELGFPAWSKDGQLLAISSVKPTAPLAISRNIFVVNLQTAQVSQITQFNDQAGTGTGPEGDKTVSSCTLPWHKAFSPDKTRIAIAALVYTGISWTYHDTNNPANPDELTTGFNATPALQIYALDGTPGALVALGGLTSNTIHSGDGVDWAPNQDLLVYPIDTQVTVRNNVGQLLTIPITPLYLIPPESNVIAKGKVTQLTFPEATAIMTWSGPLLGWQTDFQPAFSPDGKQVAYVRADNMMQGASYLPQVHSLRIVNIDGSNDHEIISFEGGEYISHLSWSPDGTKLAMDRGEEAFTTGGIPMCLADTTTCSIWTINRDGSGLTRLRSAPAAWPAWYPGPAIGTTSRPNLNIQLAQKIGANKIVLAWPAGAARFILQSTVGLGPQAAWNMEAAQPTTAGDRASVTIDLTASARFYRLLQN